MVSCSRMHLHSTCKECSTYVLTVLYIVLYNIKFLLKDKLFVLILH